MKEKRKSFGDKHHGTEWGFSQVLEAIILRHHRSTYTVSVQNILTSDDKHCLSQQQNQDQMLQKCFWNSQIMKSNLLQTLAFTMKSNHCSINLSADTPFHIQNQHHSSTFTAFISTIVDNQPLAVWRPLLRAYHSGTFQGIIRIPYPVNAHSNLLNYVWKWLLHYNNKLEILKPFQGSLPY